MVKKKGFKTVVLKPMGDVSVGWLLVGIHVSVSLVGWMPLIFKLIARLTPTTDVIVVIRISMYLNVAADCGCDLTLMKYSM